MTAGPEGRTRYPAGRGRAIALAWRRSDAFQKTAFALLALLAAFMLLPIVFVFSHAFKPINELFLYPPRFWVMEPTIVNFQNLLLRTQSLTIPFTRYLFNSVLTTALTVAFTILVSSMAAYAFSKHRFPGSKPIFAIIILSLMFAPEAVAIPRYLVIARIGIMDTYFAHVVPLLAAPVSVFLMKQFVDQLPDELLEAARMDGAGDWTAFFRLVLPICLPAVATVGILTFQASWNQMETSSLYTQTESMKTLPYYVTTLTNGIANNVVGQGIAAAATLLVFVPNLIIFLAFQRKVIATMAHSGIK
ncbi:ABC transporter permease [Paenibacillus flagellatus]|uniref:ABC transporter permease n=2 Tax=Paenibacillus flagellatus TaxID=2211139 RepID=A0A2V5KES0_9BACL|nr:ABC transporter permease [Paenibacillus flagellatus]